LAINWAATLKALDQSWDDAPSSGNRTRDTTLSALLALCGSLPSVGQFPLANAGLPDCQNVDPGTDVFGRRGEISAPDGEITLNEYVTSAAME
jgi:hypothetical protein